jgi:hypothetical protein
LCPDKAKSVYFDTFYEKMTNVPETVRRAIERDAAVRKDLARRLINVRSLARYIQKSEHVEEASMDALISAIRRYPLEESLAIHKRVGSLLKEMTMRNKIADVAILNDPEIPKALGEFASKIDYGKGETFRVVAGVESIRVVLDEKKLDEIRRLIPQKSIRKVVSGLAEIIISLGDAAESTPGLVAEVAADLAMHDINMIEFMSCVPEFVIVVDEKYALQAYEAIQNLAET